MPPRYNIAVDVCDRHPREKLAMIHEDFRGGIREVSWGELQDDSNGFANVQRSHGVERGDRVAMLLPPTPETAAAFFGVWKVVAVQAVYQREGGFDPARQLTSCHGTRSATCLAPRRRSGR